MGDVVYMAYDYPVLGAFWTIMWIFLWVMWLLLLFHVMADIFRDRKLSGWGKAAWLVFIVFIPFLGVLVYVIARGRDMGKREAEHTREQREAFDTYVRHAAAGGDTAGAADRPGPAGRTAATGAATTGGLDELGKLSELKARGDLTETEFQRAKEKLLA
jgi:hypothetical protein